MRLFDFPEYITMISRETYPDLSQPWRRAMTQRSLVFLWCAFFLGALAPETFGEAKQIETTFVRNEVARGKNLLATNDAGKILDDPYLVSAMYYSDLFFLKMRRKTSVYAPHDEVVLDLAALVTPAIRGKYIAQLRTLAGSMSTENLTSPLDHYETIARNCRSCHHDAIDLFTEEGSMVRSMSSGIVVLAERGWRPDRQFTVVSPKGGNEVIVFDPVKERFYRYCHLGSISVKVRDIIHAGQAIGTVGHSGTNASLPNHGRHLHLEINQYDPPIGANRSVMRRQLFHELERIHR